ncbi:MAG: right-handed parallel beta-helix repeat-containing protein [bacterium]
MKKSGKIALGVVFEILVLLASDIFFAPNAQAVQMNVPGDYAAIQTAIEAAHDGDMIIVSPGTYYENITFLDKVITVKSIDPNNASIVSATIIDGGKKNSVVTFDNGEEGNSSLSGFTLRNGSNFDGGGIYCDASPSITHCVIIGNTAHNRGGGIFCNRFSATISHCIIAENSASVGGGICCWQKSSPTITHCTIRGNSSAVRGGGVFCDYSSVRISTSEVIGNSSGSGGGIWCQDSSLIVSNCLMCDNSVSGSGGGIYYCCSPFPCITNCTVSRNSASGGAGIYCHGSFPCIRNSIFWGPGSEIVTDSASKLNLSYCDIQGEYPGQGNIDADPLFLDPENGDYHLQAGSPCQDTGCPRLLDHDGSPSDRGAYGGELASTPLNIAVAADGSADFTSIREAIDYAAAGDTITVLPGVYHENIIIAAREISLISQEGADSTIIDGSGSGSVIILAEVGPQGLVDGFTIKGGSACSGGGVSCYQSSLTISNCIIKDNFSSGGNYTPGGGGMYCQASSPNIINCTFIENNAHGNGGGIYLGDSSSPHIMNCTMSGNSAENDGGGWYGHSSSPTMRSCLITGNSAKTGGGVYCAYSSPILTHCTIGENSSSEGGGGIFSGTSSLTISDCLITGNSAGYGGGICFLSSSYGLFSYSSSLANCVISRNLGRLGGGIYCDLCFPRITNCTMSGNEAFDKGGGMYVIHSWPYIVNSIFWANNTEIYADSDSSPQLYHCDVQGGYPGMENINADPLFVDSEHGDYHLKAGSPCIDTGHPRIFDLDNSPSDRGAYGGELPTGPPLTITVAEDESGDFTSIQEAIDYSLTGDTIIVFPGTYRENLIMAGKDITLISQHGSESTVIDGSGSGTAVTLVSLGPQARVEGFTIQKGSAETGGGICCHQSAPIIANCTVTENEAEKEGGGIFCSCSWPTITQCTITQNSAGNEGGGIFGMDCPSALAITHCVISGNSANYGGGISFHDSASTQSSPVITYCTVTENSAGRDGGGIYSNFTSSLMVSHCAIRKNLSRVDGGGIYCLKAFNLPRILNCEITENSAYADGGGIYLEESGHDGIIGNCTVSENSALSDGGGILVKGMSRSLTITDCVISGNSASLGGGIHCKNKIMFGGMPYKLIWFAAPNPEITNCTITENKALYGGGLFISRLGVLRYVIVDSQTTVTNCIFGRNFPNQVSGPCNITSSRIPGRYPGRHNIMRNR